MQKKTNRIKGILSKHQRGFGFVIPENKEETGEKDIFISPLDMQGAMNGDTVEVRVIGSAGERSSREGLIEKVLTRSIKEIVGTLVIRGDHGYIVPSYGSSREDIIVPPKGFNGAKTGDIVAADIIKWPTKGRPVEAVVKEIISRKGEAGGDIKALRRAFQVRENFPEKVKTQIAAIPQIVSEKDLLGRKDLRNKTIITIDGADAKDLDDAISIEKLDNENFLLGVHIADVSHYVRENSPLDREALKRGTSIYLLDWVVPMLPPELSNGICSLSEGEDRLTLSVSMEINNQGEIISHEVFESVIRSNKRMVYTDVSEMIENEDKELIKKYDDVFPKILLMDQLAKILRNRRKERGSLDFDIGESHITLNKEGIPVKVEVAERRVANRIIEEFMLAANETIATHFFHLELPFIYRVHEKPSQDKMVEFKKFLASVGIVLKGSPDNVHPKTLNAILDEVRGTNKEDVVNSVMLRSMKKASYGVECLGHFGLGLKYYCHFTAPIRRYPDLNIHRIIKEFLSGGIYGERIDDLKQRTQTAADNSSVMERKAEELEREVDKLKKAEYMGYHIGEEFEGVISGIASFGFFVQLENTIEGLVRIETLRDDYYKHEPDVYRFIGTRTGKIYSLGQVVKIVVEAVDLVSREINFTLNDRDSKKKE